MREVVTREDFNMIRSALFGASVFSLALLPIWILFGGDSPAASEIIGKAAILFAALGAALGLRVEIGVKGAVYMLVVHYTLFGTLMSVVQGGSYG